MNFKKYRKKGDCIENGFINLSGVGDDLKPVWKRYYLPLLITAVCVAVALAILLQQLFLTNSCSQHGSHSLFGADFDGDTIGSLPAPSTPLHYGPPGASLNIQGSTTSVTVIDSVELTSQAMRIERSSLEITQVEAVVGDVGDMPYNSGLIYIEFMAYVEEQPAASIAVMPISVRSAEGSAALSLGIYDGTYQLSEGGGSYVPITGSYNLDTPHRIHITLDMDNQQYTLCIDDEEVITDNAFLGSFTNLRALHFDVIPAYTEAFATVYVVDDIRMTK